MLKIIISCVFILFSPWAFSNSTDSMASNVLVVNPTSQESCQIGHYYAAPENMLVPKTEGRLIPVLRLAAAAADPVQDLHLSAIHFARQNTAIANAYADLSVTGKKAYAQFKRLHEESALTTTSLLESLKQDPQARSYSEAQLAEACDKALDRAYKVANVLPYGNSTERKGLGWIAVSSEDDQPHLPVNIPATPYPQMKMAVQVGKHLVNTRYSFAETLKVLAPAPIVNDRTLPTEAAPTLSENAKVILFLHGMESQVEESLDLFRALQKIARESGENWTVVSMDFPTSGYADQFDHQDISPLSDLGSPRLIPIAFNARGTQNAPVMDFMENFIVSFVDTLEQKMPFKSKIHGVIGGSMGGNMGFRLGRRTDLPWVKNVVSWSPASIWRGLADGGDIFKQVGVATGYNRAGGIKKFLVEDEKKRANFFTQVFGGAIKIGPVTIVPAQPDQWYSSHWPCKADSLQLSRYSRYETYSKNFRLWHWRLGTESLIYSHQTPPDSKIPRYLQNHTRMMLACGVEDDFNFTNICSATKKTASSMVNTPGRAYIFENTGHSVHTERPNYFAGLIADFLR